MILATYILELNFIRSFVLSFLIKLKGIKKKQIYLNLFDKHKANQTVLKFVMPNKLRILSKL